MIRGVVKNVMCVRTTVFTVALGVVLALVLVAALAGTKPAEAAFPGANGKIAFSSDRITATNPEGDREIFTMKPDGTNVTQLTSNTELDGQPAWSADGTKIAFTSERDGNPEIYMMDADGDNQTRLINNSAADSWPAWGPRDRNLGNIAFAFTSDRDGDTDIYTTTIDANPTIADRITNNDAVEIEPTWSPTRGIAFASDRNGNFEVYVMNSDGTRQRNLTKNSASDVEPDWQPITNFTATP